MYFDIFDKLTKVEIQEQTASFEKKNLTFYHFIVLSILKWKSYTILYQIGSLF